MLSLRTSDQLRTMRHVKSYRFCPTSTGMPMWAADLGRIYQEELARFIRELRLLGRRHREELARRNRELRRHWLAAARRRQRRAL